MINQITNSADKNVFAPFQTNGVQYNAKIYSITKPITEAQKLERKKEEEKKENRFGYKIAKVALVAGFGVLLVANLFSKKSHIKAQKIIDNLEKKVKNLSENKRLTQVQNFYLKSLKGAKNVLNSSRVLFTLGSLKDVLVRKSLKQSTILTKFSDITTNFFEKVSIKTAKKAYHRTFTKFENMYDAFDNANSKISSKEKLTEVKKYINDIKTNYDSAFGIEQRNIRLTKVKKEMSDLDERFWKETYAHPIEFFKKLYYDQKFRTTFLTEEMVAKTKNQIINDVNLQKQLINSGSDNNGGIQKVLSVYKGMEKSGALSQNDYKIIEETTGKAIKSLDKSIDKETDKLYDKIRDLSLGSAPHDTLALVISAAVVGRGLTRADNNDERISVSLKYGIPAIGALATSLYCTMGLVSGGASLIIGLLSGLAMNKLGVIIDDTRKKYKEKPLTFDKAKNILPNIMNMLEGHPTNSK